MHKNAFISTKIVHLPNRILKGTERDKECLNLKLMNEEKSQKENRPVNLEKSAKERLKRVFNSVIIGEQKRMFDWWKEVTIHFDRKIKLLISVALKLRIKRWNKGFKFWR